MMRILHLPRKLLLFHPFNSRGIPRSLLTIGLLLLVSTLTSAQFGPCANNNDSEPPAGPPLAAINTYEIDAEAITPATNDFCLGNMMAPEPQTIDGCGTFLFTNLPVGTIDCPTEITFQPRQGCGNALGNVCVWVEDAGNWQVLGAPTSGDGFVTVTIPPGVTSYAITICRPGQGPINLTDVSIATCCEFTAECNLDPTPQPVEGCSVDDLPPAKTVITDVFTDIGDNPCGTLEMTSNIDAGQGNICGNGLSVIRTYTLFDDLNDNQMRDANEEFVSCAEYFLIQATLPIMIQCPAGGTVTCASNRFIGNILSGTITYYPTCLPTSPVFISPTGPVIDGTPNCPGTKYTFTYSYTDNCGRTTSCTQVFTIENEVAEIQCPAGGEVECASDITVAPIAYTPTCGEETMVEPTGPEIDGDPDCPGTTYTYTYSYTDACGRPTSCTQVFTIENDGPMITFCPAPKTVLCASDIVTTPDEVTATTSCTLGFATTVEGPEIHGTPDCPGTTYTYTYMVTDDCGRTDKCEQVFTIGENDPPTIAVVPNLTCTCIEGINPNPAWATVTTSCALGYTVTVSDPIITGPVNCPGTTVKYTYTVTDDCGRTASADQVYTIENEGPTLDCPSDCVVLGCFDGQYEAVVEAWLLTASGTSSCSDDLNVYNDYNGVDGICINNGFTDVKFYAYDDCDRYTECTRQVIIVDTDAPQIIDDYKQEPLVPCHANTQQIFNDWLYNHAGLEAYDECWTDDISWSASVGPSALDCASGPQAIVVEFTATDGCGNSSSETAVFSTKLLPTMMHVSGMIQTEAAIPVADVQVAAMQSTGVTYNMSTEEGNYEIEELAYEEQTEIIPARDGDWLNGLSTFDLLILQQHILMIDPLDSPYKLIAADANRSGTISTLDLVLLRRLILHIDEELADNTSWRFVDADFVFPNPSDPFETEFPEAYNMLGEEEEWKDFVAVKIGDFNLDAVTSNLVETGDDRSLNETLQFKAMDQKLLAGEEYTIELNSANFAQINGFQFTLEYDHSLISILDIQHGALEDFAEQNYNLHLQDRGVVPFSWNHTIAQNLSFEDVAFSITIRANEDISLSEVFGIGSTMTKAEAYQNGGLMNVELDFYQSGTEGEFKEFRLYQNQPNPFKEATTIGFILPEATEVTLEVYDVAGKLVYSKRGDYAQGYQQIELDRSMLPAGVLYYQISTAEDSGSKKMILIE